MTYTFRRNPNEGKIYVRLCWTGRNKQLLVEGFMEGIDSAREDLGLHDYDSAANPSGYLPRAQP